MDDEGWKDAVASMYQAISKDPQPPVGLIYLHPDRFDKPGRHPSCSISTTLPDIAGDTDFALAHSCQIELETSLHVRSIPELSHKKTPLDDSHFAEVCEDYLQVIHNSFPVEVCMEVERLTKGQWKNPEWYRHKIGSVGASKLADIRRVVAGGKSDSSVLNTLGQFAPPVIPTVNGKSAQKDPRFYGLWHEEVARNAYYQKESSQHEGLKLCEVGLMISATTPYLRVSPDGLRTCKCHPPRVIEIKCPWILREGTNMYYLQFTDKVTSQ